VDVTRGNAIAHTQLAHALLLDGREEEMLPVAVRAVELAPDSALAQHNLGAVYQRQGKLAAAGAQYLRALEADPDFAPSQVARGLILHEQGRFRESVRLFEAGLAADPSLWSVAEVRFRYGDALRGALATSEGFEAAVERHRAALALDPGWREVERRLAWILATHPEAGPVLASQALAHARAAAGPPAQRGSSDLEILAAAQAAAGRFERAAAIEETALEQARASGLPERSLRPMQERIALYRAGVRYVEDPRGGARP
jgi:tetratricopeptide (TPR) repeat protein